MVSVIYFNFDSNPSFYTLKALNILTSDVTHIGFQTSNTKAIGAEYLIAKNSLTPDILQANIVRAISSAKFDKILLVSELNVNDAVLQELVNSSNSLKANQCFSLLSNDIKDSTPSALVESIAKLGLEMVFAFAADKKFLSENIYNGFKTFREFIHSQLISSIALNYEILNQVNQAKVIEQLANDERAYLLEQVVNLFNIEDIYSNFDWEKYGDESAAAAYHTLGALFIKLNDYVRAEECLNISDQLEESPRSMALRAVIAHGQGQTLQAVAGLVTSLQHYEVRKKDDNQRHYLKFVPKDLESINSRLNKGLSALNHRDNETALFHFADAIYNFDDFYNEQGLKDLIS